MVIGYDYMDGDKLVHWGEAHVEALTEEGAIVKAKKILKRREYDVRTVKECFAQDSSAFQERILAAIEYHSPPSEPWQEKV
jgi:hypothetical protein